VASSSKSEPLLRSSRRGGSSAPRSLLPQQTSWMAPSSSCPSRKWSSRAYFSSPAVSPPSTAAERRRAKDRSPPPRLHSPRYLAVVKGKCFNCLSSSHRRADRCLPTRCFNCLGFHHHLRDCKRPQRSPAALGGSHACAVDASRCVVRASRDISCARPTSQTQCGTFPSLGDGGTSGALAPSTFVASDFPELDLISVSSVCFTPRSWDPMVEEAALGATVGAPFHSYREEVAGMVEQLPNPPPSSLSPCLSSHTQSPVGFRSEEEQSVGYELFKALRKLKLSSVPPLPFSSRHESPSNSEAIVVHPKGDQNHHRWRKGKIKFRKPDFKVVRDLLTKKWNIIKKDR
jgi:hypothetical protein